LLYFDVDIYEPTKIGLKFLLPRVPVGGIVAFDDFGHDGFPGETLALFQSEGFGKLERSPLDRHITWFTKVG